jgi:hypothetical protein
VQQPRRQSSSQSPPWEPETTQKRKTSASNLHYHLFMYLFNLSNSTVHGLLAHSVISRISVVFQFHFTSFLISSTFWYASKSTINAIVFHSTRMLEPGGLTVFVVICGWFKFDQKMPLFLVNNYVDRYNFLYSHFNRQVKCVHVHASNSTDCLVRNRQDDYNVCIASLTTNSLIL